MAVIIISMDVSAGEEKISWALDDVDGIDKVEVYEDTNRVVVTGCADVEEVVEKLTRRLRIPYRDRTIMSCQHPKIELSSDDDEEEEEEEEEEEDDDDEEEGHGTCFPAARIDEPWWEDQPVPDPSSWFVINLSAPPQDDDDDDED